MCTGTSDLKACWIIWGLQGQKMDYSRGCKLLFWVQVLFGLHASKNFVICCQYKNRFFSTQRAGFLLLLKNRSQVTLSLSAPVVIISWSSIGAVQFNSHSSAQLDTPHIRFNTHLQYLLGPCSHLNVQSSAYSFSFSSVKLPLDISRPKSPF